MPRCKSWESVVQRTRKRQTLSGQSAKKKKNPFFILRFQSPPHHQRPNMSVRLYQSFLPTPPFPPMNTEETEAARGSGLQQPAIATTKNIKIQKPPPYKSAIKDPVHPSSLWSGEGGLVWGGPSRGVFKHEKEIVFYPSRSRSCRWTGSRFATKCDRLRSPNQGDGEQRPGGKTCRVYRLPM